VKETEKLMKTRFIASMIGTARQGELYTGDHNLRKAHWTQWFLSNLSWQKNYKNRSYYAVNLPGTFHDPYNRLTEVKPHIEIPSWILEKNGEEFPTRLAYIGNNLLQPTWLAYEATAAKRVLTNNPDASILPVSDFLEKYRSSLLNLNFEANMMLSNRWEEIEKKLFELESITDDIDIEEMNRFLHNDFELHGVMDEKVRESSNLNQRMGCWRIVGRVEKLKISFGVLLPRLNGYELFKNVNLTPETQPTSVLLLRAILLQRVIQEGLGIELNWKAEIEARTQAFFRGVRALQGAETPQASMTSGAGLVEHHVNENQAWDALETWAQEKGYLLTVDEQSFKKSFLRAKSGLKRNNKIDKKDLETLLPLAWNTQNQVVRISFVLKHRT